MAACYFPVVSSRSLVLVGLALAVLAAGVYLFIEVRSTPAEAQVAPSQVRTRPAASPEHDEAAVTQPTEPGTGPHMGKPLDRPMAAGEVRPTAALPPSQDGTTPALADVPDKADPRYQMVLAEANKAYDRQDFDEARSIATKILAKDPTNIRMLRIMVSANCIEGDSVAAQTYYEKLPEFDRQQMTKRCSTYGVAFKEPGQ